MRVIIAGSRTIKNQNLIERAIEDSGFDITIEVSGDADGVDRGGSHWARKRNIPVREFIPDWDNINHPGAVIRRRRDGKKYDASAGHRRNKKMAEFASSDKDEPGGLILIWDGKSPGSKDMKRQAKQHGLKIYELVVCGKDREDPVPVIPSNVGKSDWIEIPDEFTKVVTAPLYFDLDDIQKRFI